MVKRGLAFAASHAGGAQSADQQDGPCVRPVDAVHMTAGHNALRGSGPGWSNSWVIAGFGGFVILAALFLVQERRSRHPMLPLSLFSQRMFALTSLDGLLVNVAFYGLIFVFSLYFQQVNGWSAFATGLAFVPMMGAVLPANLVAARLTKRFGAPAIIAGGASISAASCLALLGIAGGTAIGPCAHSLSRWAQV